MNEWMNARINEWMHGIMNELMNGWMNEWMDEWMNEWMNEQRKFFLSPHRFDESMRSVLRSNDQNFGNDNEKRITLLWIITNCVWFELWRQWKWRRQIIHIGMNNTVVATGHRLWSNNHTTTMISITCSHNIYEQYCVKY